MAGEYALVSGAVERFWVLQNQWGLSDTHDQGVFYMDAAVNWFAQLDAYAVAFAGGAPPVNFKDPFETPVGFKDRIGNPF